MERPLRILSLEHEDNAGSGVFGEVAAARGAVVQSWRVDRLGPPTDTPPHDAALVLGGGMHATQEDLHDWLRPEMDLIGEWVADGLPVVGVCLGSQLLCRAVGGTVRQARTPEIGWLPVALDAGDDPLLAHLPPRFVALQWHSYESLPPDSAVTLGRSDVCVQAFRAGHSAWGLQFHAETVRDDLEHWIAHYDLDPDAVRVGFDPRRALAALDEHIAAWNDLGRSIAERFLDHVEASARARRPVSIPQVHARGPDSSEARIYMARTQQSTTAAPAVSPNEPAQADLHLACRELFERADIRTAQFGCPDVDGLFRGKRVPAQYFLDSVAHTGSMIADILFGWDIADTLMDGLKHSGWHTGYADLVLMPDLATVKAVPWEPGVATAICDVRTPEGVAVEIAPRRVLQRQVERAADLGYTFSIGYELEFYLFKETPYSVIDKGYRDLVPATPELSTYSLHRLAMIDEVICEIRERMNAYGVPIEAANTEYGPGQIEINIHHCPPLEAADRVLLYKDGVRQIAEKHGYVACFMAKVSGDGAGSSGHIHQSIRQLDEPEGNAFWDPDGRGESRLMRKVIAGQIAAMPELTVFHCPTVNSYKRKVEGSWAPTSAVWGRDNRTTALRVIAREAASCRIEHRLPGADANPYLAIAACIGGALHGIQHDLMPPEPVVGNAYEQSGASLPASLEEAIAAVGPGTVSRAAFGDEFVDHFLATRRWERDRHREAVSDWERRRYFARI